MTEQPTITRYEFNPPKTPTKPGEKIPAGLILFGMGYLLWTLFAWACVALWAYGVWSLFIQQKILEAAAAFVVFPLAILYGLFRFLGVW